MPSSQNAANFAELAKQYTVLDNVSQRIAQLYSEALYQAAFVKGNADEVQMELEEINSLLENNSKFEQLFAIPIISRNEKSGLIKNVFEGKSSALVCNFLHVLNEHDRLGLLRATVYAYQSLNETKKNQQKVQVVTPVKLTPEQESALAKTLQDKLGKQPILCFSVDDSIVGGLIIKAGDWLWDGSLRNRLHTLRNQLIERSTYEIQSGRNSLSSSEGN